MGTRGLYEWVRGMSRIAILVHFALFGCLAYNLFSSCPFVR